MKNIWNLLKEGAVVGLALATLGGNIAYAGPSVQEQRKELVEFARKEYAKSSSNFYRFKEELISAYNNLLRMKEDGIDPYEIRKKHWDIYRKITAMNDEFRSTNRGRNLAGYNGVNIPPVNTEGLPCDIDDEYGMNDDCISEALKVPQ